MAASITDEERNSTTALSREWAHLQVSSSRSPITGEAQTTIVQILLENIWRDADTTDDEDPGRWAAEAIMMLLVLLGTSAPRREVTDTPVLYHYPFHSYLAIHDVKRAVQILFTEYIPIAAKAFEAVKGSSSLIENTLDLYQAIIINPSSQSRRIPLWSSLNDNRQIFRQAPLQPVLLDLWQFLLMCARSESTRPHLQTASFVKLCLVLVQPGPADNPDEPVDPVFVQTAADWEELVPVLVQTAKEGNLAESFPFANMKGTIPALAKHALDRLTPNALDIPDGLRAVLARLAGTAPKSPSPERGEPRTTMLHRWNPMRMVRRLPSGELPGAYPDSPPISPAAYPLSLVSDEDAHQPPLFTPARQPPVVASPTPAPHSRSFNIQHTANGAPLSTVPIGSSDARRIDNIHTLSPPPMTGPRLPIIERATRVPTAPPYQRTSEDRPRRPPQMDPVPSLPGSFDAYRAQERL